MGTTLFLVFSLGIIAVVAGLSHTRWRAKASLLAALGLAIAFAFAGSKLLMAQGLFTAFLCVFCAATKSRDRGVYLSAVVAGGAVMFFKVTLVDSMAKMREGWLADREVLRREFPMEQLDQRLEYEGTEPVDENSKIRKRPEYEGRELQLFGGPEYHKMEYRKAALKHIHDREYDAFIRRSGFGLFRMKQVQREEIQVADNGPLPLPPIPADDLDDTSLTTEQLTARRAKRLPAVDRGNLNQLHGNGLTDFLDRARMGYVRAPRLVAGFIPHRFTKMPTPEREPESTDDEPARRKDKPAPSNRWRITSLELVSLLKHKQPAVYVSRYLPRMDLLKTAPTRALTEFETEALRQLRNGESLVHRRMTDHHVMLGAVRAKKSCLRCHFVKTGDLLGAFSYELYPEPTAKGGDRESGKSARIESNGQRKAE